MSRSEVVRAWKDRHLRAALTTAQRSRLPEHPAGVVEVPESDLRIAGGAEVAHETMFWPCPTVVACPIY